MNFPDSETPVIAVNDLLQSISQTVGKECEKSKRSILRNVETSMDTSFDNLKRHISNLLNQAFEDETARDDSPHTATKWDQPVSEHVDDSDIEVDDIDLIKIEDDSDNHATSDEGADEDDQKTTTTTKELDTKSKVKNMNKMEDLSIPDVVLNAFPVLIKEFDTYEEADQYRRDDNFRHPHWRYFDAGKVVYFVCLNYLQCKAKACIWKLNYIQRCQLMSNGIQHNHDQMASTRKIDPQTIDEIKRVMKKGVRTPKDIFEHFCKKYGADAVNGFDIIRGIQKVRNIQ